VTIVRTINAMVATSVHSNVANGRIASQRILILILILAVRPLEVAEMRGTCHRCKNVFTFFLNFGHVFYVLYFYLNVFTSMGHLSVLPPSMRRAVSRDRT